MNEAIFTIHDMVLIVAGAECLLLAITRSLIPSESQLETKILVCFLIVISFNAFANVLIWNEGARESFGFISESTLVVIDKSTHTIRGALLLLYIKASIDSDFRIKKSTLLHLIPLIVYVALIIENWISGRPVDRSSIPHIRYYTKFVSLAYTAAVAFYIYQYHVHLKDRYSSYTETGTLWLSFLCGGFLFTWSWTLIIVLWADLVDRNFADSLGTFQNWVYFLVINCLFVYTLVYTNRLLRLPSSQKSTKSNELPGDDIIAKVMSGIEDHKLHLEPGISIDQFAATLKLPSKSVSTVLNRLHGTNFFEFINSHRVEHAKDLLSSNEYSSTSILDILLLSGFNNKTSFHRCFNRIVGMPPNEYRKKQLRKARSESTKEGK